MFTIRSHISSRRSGVLLPVFSLPSDYGTGCFSGEARNFIEFLHNTGQSFWQILPLGPVNESRSPYQPLSSFAGNPAFIDPDELRRLGLITETELNEFRRPVSDCAVTGMYGNIQYSRVIPPRMKLLRTAYERFAALPADSSYKAGYGSFVSENAWWLDDYTYFTVLSEKFGSTAWTKWPDEYKYRDTARLSRIDDEMPQETGFVRFMQYEFFRELEELRSFAHSAGIKIIGDLPFYTAAESADCWSHPEIFVLGKNLEPEALAGCPPDSFTPEGQLWNNPLYRWHDAPEKTSAWWAARLRHNLRMTDVLRLDHFRGFESYFSIPASDAKPALGHWEPGPGAEFFRNLPADAFPKGAIIAEDLGSLTTEVYDLRDGLGLPGMKVLQFAFDSGSSNPYLPGNFGPHSVVYTGTHDNDTVRGWYESLSRRRKNKIRFYTGNYIRKHRRARFNRLIPAGVRSRWIRGQIQDGEIADAMVLMAESSRASVCIIPFQDILGAGSSARINTPGTAEGNWCFELGTGLRYSSYVEKFARVTEACGRQRHD
ncbi:MAG: 4-alpha-glucanotransferase [Anaerovoracaceae bacterium]